MSKSKAAARVQRNDDQFERQKIRHIKHDKVARHLAEEIDTDEVSMLSSADLQRLDGYEGF